MENYEKKYKELESKIKKAYLYAQTDSTKAVLEYILPELLVKKNYQRKEKISAKAEHLIPQKGMYYTCIKDYYSSDNTHLCVKGNVYKSSFNGYIDDESHFGLSWTNSPTEKYFEPTKDEDWIVCEHDNVIGKPMQYKEFKKKVNQKFIENLKAKGITPKLRLWTVKDAKDGDILATSAGAFIYNGNNGEGCCPDRVQPQLKHDWSEEDEKNLNGVIGELEANKSEAPEYDYKTYDKFIDWLESLKERCTWKPSEEQMDALEHFVRSIGESGFVSPYDANLKLVHSLLNDLKKLK